MHLSDLGEFGLIDRLHRLLGPSADADLVQGIQDDAAVYRIGDGRVHVVTTDALLEGYHFDRSFTPLDRLGFKAIAVNVSDVAAMNARPRFATIALGLPSTLAVEDVEALYRGIARACERFGVTVVGGDTTASASLVLSITAIGEAREEDVVYRHGAQPGDLICVTGDLGAAYAGLKLLLENRDALRRDPAHKPDFSNWQYVLARQLAPTPRIEAVEAWSRAKVRPTALIDVSDGVASEIHHLCDASGTGALLYEAALPIDSETRALANRFEEDVDVYALFGGEDYELLFTIAERDFDRLPRGLFVPIGRMTEPEAGVHVQTADTGERVPLQNAGFNHFATEGDGQA